MGKHAKQYCEEAAMLIKLQQAYQAAAKVIQVSDKMFQVLINTI